MPFYKRLYHYCYLRRQLLSLTLILTLFTAWLSYYNHTETIDWLVYDTVQQFSQLPPSDDVIIIDIDEKSIAELGRWPWSRDVHASIINQLSSVGAKAIVFDVIFADIDEANPVADQLFADAIDKHGGVILPLYIKQIGLRGQVLEVPPAPLFYQASHSVGHVHVSPSRDGVVRNVFLKEGVGEAYWPHVSVALWTMLGNDSPLPGSKPKHESAVDNSQLIVRSHLNYLPMPNPNHGLIHHSYVDVLGGDVDEKSIKNKTVFIGAAAAGLGDTVTTSIGSMSGVQLNAWIYQALRSSSLIQEATVVNRVWINSLLVFVLIMTLCRLSPRAFLTSTLCTVIGLLALTACLQLFFNWWFPIIPAIIAIVACYPLWNWWRLEVALLFLRQEINDLNKVARQGQRLTGGIVEEHSEITSSGTELITQTIERLVATKRLADANQRLIQQSLAELQDAVVISDLHGRIMFTNNAFNLLAINVPEMKITGISNLMNVLDPIELVDNKSWDDKLQQLYKNKTSFNIQCFHPLLKKDLYCQSRLVNIGGEIEDTLIITFTDISQLKAAEKARSEALNFLSHDLRSPMVSVLAIIERQRSLSVADELVLSPIEVLVRKNLEYADSFLQLSRAESLQTSQLHLCDLHSVLDAAQMHGLALVEGKNIKLVTERMDGDAWIYGDQDLLERALINLLSNAVKYSPAGSAITLSLNLLDNYYQLSVIDQGCGIAEENKGTLFDRYTRSGQHDGVMGAGLGLYFVATVVKRHHGDVYVESVEGKGSKFTLRLKQENIE